VHDHFISNPHSKKAPMQRYGMLKKGSRGENFYETDEGVQLPYIGPVLDYKEDDPQHLRPQLRYNACVAQWNLSDKDDMEQYRAYCDKLCKQQAIASFEEKEYDPDIKSWRVLCRWMEPYYGPPSNVLRQAKEDAQSSGGMPPPRKPRPIRSGEPLPKQPKDLALVEAEEFIEEQDSDTEEPTHEVPSRYGTFDEAISAFGDLLPELGQPFDTEPENSSK
jgi:hypothetical protein